MIDEATPIPSKITLNKRSHQLLLEFDNGEILTIPCAYLRLHSPSADMTHGEKKDQDYTHVNILAIEPVGQYAIKPIFSDGHRTGIYSWSTLYRLAMEFNQIRRDHHG